MSIRKRRSSAPAYPAPNITSARVVAVDVRDAERLVADDREPQPRRLGRCDVADLDAERRVLEVVGDLVVRQRGGGVGQAGVERQLVVPVRGSLTGRRELGELDALSVPASTGGQHVAEAARVVGPIRRDLAKSRGRRHDGRRDHGREQRSLQPSCAFSASRRSSRLSPALHCQPPRFIRRGRYPIRRFQTARPRGAASNPRGRHRSRRSNADQGSNPGLPAFRGSVAHSRLDGARKPRIGSVTTGGGGACGGRRDRLSGG